MDSDNVLILLIAGIKNKKELSGIDNKLLEKELGIYFRKNSEVMDILKKYASEKQLKKSAEYGKIIKSIRAKLHSSYGMFQIPSTSEGETVKSHFLRKLKARQDKDEDYNAVLSLHLSTKERIPYYSFIYKQIFKIVKPKTILDLGCGLNPLSCHYMNLINVTYIASDIDKTNLEFIKVYFELSGIKGEVLHLDILNKEDIQKLAFIESDVCFMLKLLEIDKRIAEDLITAVDSKYIVASFPTINIQGKIMSNPERDWLEKMLNRLKYKFSVFKTENEIFYIIRKS